MASAAEDEAAPEAMPFSARVMIPSAPSDAATQQATLVVTSHLDRPTELVLDLRALDETQQAQVTVSLGALAANETLSFRLPLEALGLTSASLQVGGLITLMPRLRDVDGLLTPGHDGPLVIGYHFDGSSLLVYDMATRTVMFSGGRLDGVPWDGIVLSPARVVERGPPVPGEDDAEPDPDHELAREAP
ncbi:MAG: hypothetical protein HYS27_21355 [Deltaproteobacteria bacterium]|nr:hypothetical protein [Deltaproteobacteria bacterium]